MNSKKTVVGAVIAGALGFSALGARHRHGKC